MAKFLKLKTKASAAIAEGNTYEALQIFRTVRNRCKDAAHAAECLNMLHDGAVLFGKNKEETTVLDIAEVYAETLNAFNVEPSELIYNQIKELFSLLPSNVSQSNTESSDLRLNFVNTIFKWSKAVSTRSFRKLRGDPRLHRDFADVYVEQGNNSTAKLHFLLANDPDALSKFLIAYDLAQDGRDDHVSLADSDLHGAQTALQLLTYKKLRVAQAFLVKYTVDHPKIKSSFPYGGRPLLNFVFLLFTVLSEKSFAHFGYLVEKYSPVITAECEYKGLVDKVGQIYFNLPARESGGSFGLLSGLLKGLMPQNAGASATEAYSADEAMDPAPTKRALTVWPVNIRSGDFAAQNAAADKVTAPGLLKEPQQEERAALTEEDDFHDAREEVPQTVEMDLD
uniref:Golgi to ER traffic protein 4 n=1 Tax=Panagrellus redivivus TaxID=6233 RepID=A0A7E4VHI2_PANRE